MSTFYDSQLPSLNGQIAADAKLAQSLLEQIIASSPLDTMEVRLAALAAFWGNALGVVRKSHQDLRMTLVQAPVLQSTQKQTQSSGPIHPDSEGQYSTAQIPRVTDVGDSSSEQEYHESSFATPPHGFLAVNPEHWEKPNE